MKTSLFANFYAIAEWYGVLVLNNNICMYKVIDFECCSRLVLQANWIRWDAASCADDKWGWRRLFR